jgi:hypothetical protein
MGQVLVPEEISDLTITGALTLSLDSSIVNIGGQQYRTAVSSSLDMSVSGIGGLDTGAIAADTDYFVYTVLDGISETPLLVASLANEDMGPTGFTTWRLIGAFNTDGSSQVDSVYSNTSEVGKPIDISNAQNNVPEATETVPGLIKQTIIRDFSASTITEDSGFNLTINDKKIIVKVYEDASGQTYADLTVQFWLSSISGSDTLLLFSIDDLENFVRPDTQWHGTQHIQQESEFTSNTALVSPKWRTSGKVSWEGSPSSPGVISPPSARMFTFNFINVPVTLQ